MKDILNLLKEGWNMFISNYMVEPDIIVERHGDLLEILRRPIVLTKLLNYDTQEDL